MKTEQERILDIIRENNEGPSSLIQVLTLIQEEHGYLPKEVQQLVAKELNIPFSRVYEVTTFYARFTTEQKGRYEITVCLGTACYVKGAGKILETIEKRLGIKAGEVTPDGMFSIEDARCIGACGLAPVIIINGDVYGQLTPADIDGIIEKYEKIIDGDQAV